jgi:16S rRNA (cytosine1402-N4)-methyltransferase
MTATYHEPVLRDEVLSYLMTDTGGTYVDATVGGGGHAEGISTRLGGDGRLICLDLDEDALRAARQRLLRFSDRVTFVHANFRDLRTELRARGVSSINGLLLDLGVSSYQLDEGSKGFSFRSDDPIDMRMDRRQPLTGRDVVNTYDEPKLGELLWKFGEERRSRRIARSIVEARDIETTGALAAAVESAVGKRFLTKTLARVFQAIRIEVNGELKNLERILADVPETLSPGGRVVVLSYHSLEDRIVKESFRKESAERMYSGHKYVEDRVLVPTLRILTKRPVVATAAEAARNPRARSAKMRVAERLGR